MTLHSITRQVLDVAATEQAIAFAAKDTSVSFYFCDWETLQCRPISESAYLQMKFGGAGSAVADALGEPFSCRAARLPDGGCAVLRSDAMLCLFRPDGRMGTQFFLGYQNAPAYDIVSEGNMLWFTAPAANALVLFSLQEREMELRVGGPGIFPRPLGVSKAGNALLVSCAGGTGEVKTLLLPSYELDKTIPLLAPPEKYYRIFRRGFLWTDDGFYACEE